MAVNQVTSSYNVRRRKQSASILGLPDSDPARLAKRLKVEKREPFTPPASPEASDLLSSSSILYDDDYEDPILIGILDFMQRTGVPAMCSREISESLQAEGKVKLTGSTPSTLVDAAIKQHHKRCSSTNRPNIIQKISDPRFPRKTLYHLATVDPFGPTPASLSPAMNVRGQIPLDRTVMQRDLESETSDSEVEDDSLDHLDTLSNDGQGPFAASLDTRRRMSMSPSPELEFSLSIQDAKRSIATPVASEPASPSRGPSTKIAHNSRLNIAAPPSPFITPRAGDEQDDEEDSEQQSSLRLPGSSHTFMNSPLTLKRQEIIRDDFCDVEVQSPEALTLDELDTLLGF